MRPDTAAALKPLADSTEQIQRRDYGMPDSELMCPRCGKKATTFVGVGVVLGRGFSNVDSFSREAKFCESCAQSVANIALGMMPGPIQEGGE